MFEVGLIQFLKNNSGISALVGGRIFAGRIPKTADSGTYPCIVWAVVSTVDVYSIQGASGFRTKRIQVDCYDRWPGGSYMNATRVADAVRGALQSYRGTFPDGTKVDSSIVITDQDFLDEPGVSGQLFRRMLEFQIAYQE